MPTVLHGCVSLVLEAVRARYRSGWLAGSGVRGRPRIRPELPKPRDVRVGIGALDVHAVVEILVGCKSVNGVGLRAIARAERADFRSMFVFVVEALVRSLCVNVELHCSTCARRVRLVRKIQSA